MATKFDQLLLAKIETTKGTDSVPTAGSNAIRCKSFKVSKSQTNIDRPSAKQTMGNLAHLIGKETAQIEIVLEARGGGAAGTAPEFGPLLSACRLVETVSAGVDVSYDPSTGTEHSVTIYAYIDGLLWKLIGAVGTAKADCKIDATGDITFTMQAAYTAPTTASVPSGATYQDVQPIVMGSADVISDGSAVKVGAFSLDFGNDVFNHYSTGENSFSVQNRKPSITFTKDSVNTAAEWTALSSGTDASLSASFGSTAGNIMTITAPSARRNTVGYGEKGERISLDVSYGLYESSGDDQFSIVFS